MEVALTTEASVAYGEAVDEFGHYYISMGMFIDGRMVGSAALRPSVAMKLSVEIFLIALKGLFFKK
jgi:hypothetical protein